MYKLIIIVVITTTTLSSCATTRWEHPTKKQTSSYLDLLHCKQDASQYAADSGYSQDKTLIKNETDKCMNEKYGWIKEKDYPLRYYLPFPFNLFLAYQ
jgi:hypothetical protein